MTIESVAFIEQTDGFKVSKDKTVTVHLDSKGNQSHKFDGAYLLSHGADLYSNHLQKNISELVGGTNGSVVTISSNSSVDSDAIYLGESSLLGRYVADVFSHIARNSGKSKYLVSISMLQVSNNGIFTDLVSPQGRNMTVMKHSKQGMFVDGLSQVVCTSADEALKLYEDGYQALNALKLSPCVVSFTVKILQRPTGSRSGSSTISSLRFVTYYSEKSNAGKVFPLLSEVAQRKGKLNKAASDDSAASEILLDALLGNSNTCLLASVGGNDTELSNQLLAIAAALSGLGPPAKVNRDDSEVVMQQLRSEIAKVRNRLASQSPPNKNDLAHMEKLMRDLDETKRSGWEQTVLRSDQFYEERKINFANRGLSWILESTKKANRENVKNLQKQKNKLTAEYKNQRHLTDRLNTDLKEKIEDYTQLINSGTPDDNTKKSHVAAISELKERHKVEMEKSKQIKSKLKDVQNQLQLERQSGVEESSSSFDVAFRAMAEEREKTRQDNEQLVEEELDKMKVDVEQEKADLQMKFSSQSLVKSDQEVLQHRIELAQLQSEKSVITTQLDVMKKERAQMEEHMRILAEKHSRELEIQQLQNLQTFRAYREVFEEYKAELENRWRALLDDAVQDAVFLHARNNEMAEENAKLKLEIAKFQDKRSIGKAINNV